MNSAPAASPSADVAGAAALRSKYEQAGQGQVFQFWEKLRPAERAALCLQAAQIDLAEISRLVETHLHSGVKATVDLSTLRPAPSIARPENGGNSAQWQKARDRGEAALRAGSVACFTVAGGQGTRLGFDGPKGAFPVTPVRGHSLFQVFAEKIRAAGEHYGKTPPWLILTSPANHAATQEFFGKHAFFGLDSQRVFFFTQGTMPAVDFAGKIMLEAPGRIALSPDGHGGSLRALARSGAMDILRDLGVKSLSYFQVDNPLVRCVDAEFIGFHLETGSEMSTKMIPKRDAGEKIGHLCLDPAGRVIVVEYSDMPRELCEAREPQGELRFRAGSIGIHVLDCDFVARIGAGRDAACRLPFHRADKKVATIDANGRPVQPEKPNGVKFEMFVFDALPFARQATIIETDRAEDFSPVKNATGIDSAETCRDDQLRQFARWLNAAGAKVPVDATGRPPFALEISPLFGDDAGRVAAHWNSLSAKPKLADGLVLT
ncbi:MAG TPA: UDPGP type 1 family protein [Opitutales bacterium]|nr:UDPGP type 1 family protein [Opitutales bacterium]